MIKIRCSKSLETEKKYIFDVVIKEFLGLEYKIEFTNEVKTIELTINTKILFLDSTFWKLAKEDYLNENLLPDVKFTENPYTIEHDIPILFGHEIIERSENAINCGLDIFGSCFFMLSRMEEAIINERDHHNRFAGSTSIAYKYNFLDRPIVDEYVEMLWNMISQLDPTLKRSKPKPTLFITCDVDFPYDSALHSIKKTARKSVGDLIKRKNFKSFFETWKNYFFYKLSLETDDEIYDNLYWIMDQNEAIGNKVAFYFIPYSTDKKDNPVDFSSSKMCRLLNDIHHRGHEIGIHPGYNCFNNEHNFKISFNKLKETLAKLNINQPIIGGRMHYLRWNNFTTPQLWEQCELQYDSSLSFADLAGFRCGTSKEFSMFDLKNRQKLNLKQRPLITMDCTIIEDRYEGLGYSNHAFDRFFYFKNKCKQYNGQYVLLWHNNFFKNRKDKELYINLINNNL
ncbi:polysaccharide deacetylase family protein [Pseudemcibacter aquimaris]|uniref:polysaccharide deacetylase family protein n=1 Tax=Pseudemcibacter aquimaris TaxID=2857064 RepID=UPI002011A761|nr:polysaccharide deacetylase family protein [Pseudemcibacter aquimaris]MCC3861723.1 polysaccharide deacetylase family protein [Pseudemcibacter aquimaris]WDU58492.1 polysaccharide deacetylase family protein [Pseudemcibacter aquimaris]